MYFEQVETKRKQAQPYSDQSRLQAKNGKSEKELHNDKKVNTSRGQNNHKYICSQ